MTDDLAADTQIVLCTAPGMMYPVEDVLSAAVCTTYVLSAPSVYVLCAALNGCELSVCAGIILFIPHVLSIQSTMVRMCCCSLDGCVLSALCMHVHYMVRSMLLSILYVFTQHTVCTRGVYVLYAICSVQY